MDLFFLLFKQQLIYLPWGRHLLNHLITLITEIKDIHLLFLIKRRKKTQIQFIESVLLDAF